MSKSTVFLVFSKKPAKTVPEPKAGRPSPHFLVKIVKKREKRQRSEAGHEPRPGSQQGVGCQRVPFSAIFSKFSKFTKFIRKSASPCPETVPAVRNVQFFSQKLHISDLAGTWAANSLVPGQINKKTSKSVKNRQNRSKNIKIGQKPSKSVKNRENPCTAPV